MSEEAFNSTFQKKIITVIKENLKKIIILLTFLVLILFAYFFYNDLQKKK